MFVFHFSGMVQNDKL
ncbi:UNVERIFIED_CONTAM: hypothetical protein GTU68_066897 [Idotea baltica]|nr:hypothetical protein [Idotea baltica]